MYISHSGNTRKEVEFTDRVSGGSLQHEKHRLLVYAPDAIGRGMIEAAGFRKFSVRSVFPSKMPVCYASMFSGLKPEEHGIRKYEKPVLACKTIFDALPAALFAPDHGAHTDPATGKGTHGDDVPADMDVAHFWKIR